MKTILLIAILLALVGCQSLEKPRDSDLAGVYYRVKPHDTLAQIAKKHKVSVSEIKDVNGIDNDRALKVGQALFLPDPDPIGTKIAKLTKKTVAHQKSSPKKKTSEATAVLAERIFAFPLPGGTIIHSFSKAKDTPYDGIGIKAPFGSKVLSALDGRVLFVGDDGTRFGLLVIVEHKDPYITVYTQLETATVLAGQQLKKGQPLGTVGKSGGASIPHLHFQLRINKKPVDPRAYLKGF